MQLLTQEQANAFPFDHLDPTKLIPEALVPLQVIGRMVLDRWPDNFFAETEHGAFCPSHMVPGIDFSNDPLLQGRLFSYLDTQLSQLGSPNFHQLPINAPTCPFANYQRDAHLPMLQSKYAQAHIASALVFELSKVEHPHVREAVVAHLRHIDENLATRVAAGLAMDNMPAAPRSSAPVQDLPKSPALQIIGKMKDTLQRRSIAILAADGSDAKHIKAFSNAITAAGARVTIVAPKIGSIKLQDGSVLVVDGQLAGTPSVLFDAIVLVLAEDAAKRLCKESCAVDFLRDAFAHLKAIAADAGALALLKKADIKSGAGVFDISQPKEFVAVAKIRQGDREKTLRTLA